MPTESSRETIIKALTYYAQWMDALCRTNRTHGHEDATQAYAVEKYKAEQALTEMENTQ